MAHGTFFRSVLIALFMIEISVLCVLQYASPYSCVATEPLKSG